MKRKPIVGIFTPNMVPLHGTGRINEEELRRYLEWLIQKGINGIYPNGSTGEFIRFSYEERQRITQIVAYTVRDRVPIIAGASEANVQMVLKACEFYAELGCDAVSICVPYYFKLSQESVRAYFTEIARNTPIDVLLYNIPQFANEIGLDVLKHLAEFPRIFGMKDSSRNLPYFVNAIQEVRAIRPDFVFLTGTEEMLLPALLMGADGGTIATSGVVPEAVMRLYDLFLRRDFDRARQVQLSLLPAIRVMMGIEFPEGFRAGVALRGFQMGHGRQTLSEAQVAELGRLREALLLNIRQLVADEV